MVDLAIYISIPVVREIFAAGRRGMSATDLKLPQGYLASLETKMQMLPAVRP